MFAFFKKNRSKSREHVVIAPTQQAGFTVMEMIVVISIFSMMAGIVLFNFDAFKNNTDFTVAVQEVALLIKEQQHNALAGKLPDIDPGLKEYPLPAWKPAYGIYFDVNTPEKMSIFYDNFNDDLIAINPGGIVLDCGNSYYYECMQEMFFEDIRLHKICEGGYEPSNDSCNTADLETFSTVFKRPYPDARMRQDYDPEWSVNAINPNTILPVTSNVDLVFILPGSPGKNTININPVGILSIKKSQ